MLDNSRDMLRFLRDFVRAIVLLMSSLAAILASASNASAQAVNTGDGMWVWQTPLRVGQLAYYGWSADPNNLWTIGPYGTIMKWDGKTWQVQRTNGDKELLDIWGTDVNNIWAVGEGGTILKWDGISWREQDSNAVSDLHHVWGTDINNVWVTGDSTILRWNGARWIVLSGLTGAGAPWGTGADDVWLTVEEGMAHWDGSTWTIQDYGVDNKNPLMALWSDDAGNVWQVGLNGTIYKWDGHAWNKQESGTTANLLNVWGIDANNVWAIGSIGTVLKWDGSTWTKQDLGTEEPLDKIWGTDFNHIWIRGGGGISLFEWDGKQWSQTESGQFRSMTGIWGTDANNVWAVGKYGTILKWNSSEWSTQDSGTMDRLNAIWGTDANNIWAVGDAATVVKWNGSTWSKQNAETTEYLYAVAGSNINNIYALASRNSAYFSIMYLAGTYWRPLNNSTRNGCTATDIGGPSGLLAVDECGAIYSFNGVKWSRLYQADSNWELARIWEIDNTHTWVVGHDAQYHGWAMLGDNQSWTSMLIPTMEPLTGIWGKGLNLAWAVGGNKATRWNGSTWSEPEDTGIPFQLAGIWEADENNIWAISDGGVILWRHPQRLYINQLGGGSGSVARTPAGIACGGNCIEFGTGVEISLTPAAQPGSSFAGWSGACSGTGKCQIIMDSAKTVTAMFIPNANFFDLTIEKAGTGNGAVASEPAGLQCGDNCVNAFLYGTQVTLSAAADSNSMFIGWSGACSGPTVCTVSMEDTKTVRATFAARTEPAIRTTAPTVANSLIGFESVLGVNDFSTCTWDFGDGQTDDPCVLRGIAPSEVAPQIIIARGWHWFSTPGNYTVTVTAKNAVGATSLSMPITVLKDGYSVYIPMAKR